MSDNDGWLYQISFKTAGQTMINLRGSTKEELAAGMEILQELATDITTTENVIGVLQPILGASKVPSPPATNLPPQEAPAPPPVAPQAPVAQAAAPMCKHGLPAKFVPGGVSKKTNRPYKAFWACSQDQAYQCDFRQDG